MIKGILFDMDGLMFNTEELVFTIFAEKAKEKGLQLDEEVYKNCMGAGINGRKWMEKNRPELAKIEFTYEEEIAYRDAHYEKGDLNMPGLEELYRYLKNAGYKIALGSNSPLRWVESMLEFSGIDFVFDAMSVGEAKLPLKPDPAIYLDLAQKLGLPIEECLVVEDSMPGIHAGFNGGFKTALIEALAPIDEKTRAEATYRPKDLAQLITILEDEKID